MPTQNLLQTLLLVAAAAGAANPLAYSPTAEALQADVDFSTKDLTSEQWKAKFKYLDDNKGVHGSMRKAAGMAPAVPYTTLRGRYLTRATAPTSFGPKPMLGCDVESVIVDHCKQQHAAGFSVSKVFIIACAKKAAVDLGGADAAASIGGKKWYKAFLKRHPDVKEMTSSLMEEERTHAVGRESVGRYFTLAEVALTGVKPENTWFADEAYLEFHSKRGWAVSRATKRARLYSPSNTFPQCIVPANAKSARFPDPEVNKHWTWMGCVSAVGHTAAPLLIVEGERQFARFNEQWPECAILMDSKGYMTKEHFFAWVKVWEESTRPADPTEPRALFLDNHYSHNVIDATAYLIEHNVRLVALHPHTTHVLCALDCGVFRSFKHWFRHFLSLLQTVMTDKDVSGLVKKAWGKALELTIDPVSKKATSTAIRAFARVGLVPFDRTCVDETHFGPSDLYKTETEPTAPNGKRTVLTPTPEYVQKLKAELSGTPGLTAQLKAKLAAAPRTQMSQIMSHSDILAAEIDKQIKAKAEADRKAEFPWNKLGITQKEYNKRERERKDAERATKKEAAAAKMAAAKAAQPKSAEAALPLKGKKRKVAAVEPAEAAVAAPPAAAPKATEVPAQKSAHGRVVVKKARA